MAQHPPRAKDRREIVEGEHGMDARQCARPGGIDVADRGVRMRAAHECGVQQARQHDVVDEAAAAGEQGPILEPRNSRSDQCIHAGRHQSNKALVALAMTSLGVA